jgi:hypothetical protein
VLFPPHEFVPPYAGIVEVLRLKIPGRVFVWLDLLLSFRKIGVKRGINVHDGISSVSADV